MTKRRPAPRDSYRPDAEGGDRDRRGRSRERTPPPPPIRARDPQRRESPPKDHDRDRDRRRERSRSARRGRERERSVEGAPLGRDIIIGRRERPDDRDMRRRTPSPLSKRKRSPSPRQQKRVKKRRNRKGRPDSLERRRPDLSPPRHRSPGRRHDPRDPRSGREMDRDDRGIRRRSRSPTKSRVDPANDLSRFFEAPRPPSPAGSANDTRKKRETTPGREPGSPPKRRRLSRSPRRDRERSPPRRDRSSRHGGRDSPPRRKSRSPHGDRRRRDSPRSERQPVDRRSKDQGKNGTRPNPPTPDDEKKEKEKEAIKEKEKVLDPEFQARFQPISQKAATIEATESEQPTLEIPTGPAADRNGRPGSLEPNATTVNTGPKDRGWGLQIQTPFEIANQRPPPSQPRAFRQSLFNTNSSTTVTVQSQVQTPTPITPQSTGFIKPPPTGPALAAQSHQFQQSMRGRHGFAMAVPMRGRGGMHKAERGMGRGYAIKTSMAPAAQQIQIQQAYEIQAQQEIFQQDPTATAEIPALEQQQHQEQQIEDQATQLATQLPPNTPTGPSSDVHPVTFRPFSLGLNKKPAKQEPPTRPQQQQQQHQQHQSHRKAEPPRNAPRGPRGSEVRSASNSIVAHVRVRGGRGRDHQREQHQQQHQKITIQPPKQAPPPAPKPPPKPRPPVKHYERITVVGEGTYGKVYKAKNTFTGSLVALKKLRMEGERDGFPVTAVREMKLLQQLRHENILCLYEMMVENNACYMVFEYMDHDLTGILKHPTFHLPPGQIKHLARQFFCGLQYLHHRGVLHRDLKNSNILVSTDGVLKIADFGLARPYSKRKKGLDYTNRIITLWYRPPEVLLGATQYGPSVDIWSAGCVFIEFFTRKAIFQGRTDIDQLDIIYDVLGTPAKDAWPALTTMPWYNLLKTPVTKPSRFREDFGHLLSPKALELVEWTFNYDPDNRPTAEQVLQHPYFTEELPLAEPPIGLRDLQGDWHEYEAKSRERKLREKEKTEKRAAAAAAASGQ